MDKKTVLQVKTYLEKIKTSDNAFMEEIEAFVSTCEDFLLED